MNEPNGVRVWFAVLGGIGAWIVHLTAESALARRTCVSGQEWVLHVLTVGLAGVTVAAMLLAARLRDHECWIDGDARTATSTRGSHGDLRFLGTMGLLIGAINLLLIVFEGALVFWVPSCG
jgi:hypothetical protein